MALDPAAVDVAGPSGAPAIVLVHGSVVSRKVWLPQLRSLADAHRVIAPDLPGHGALAGAPFTFAAAVETVAGTIDREASGRALVVGLSLGGYVAIELAHRHPDKVEALILAGSSVSFTGALGLYLKAVSGLMRQGWLRQSPQRLEAKTRRLFPPELEEAAREQLRAGLHAEPLGDAFAELAGRDWTVPLRAFDGPVLILNGERDRPSRRGEQRFLAAARRAQVRTLEGAGHACNLDRPAAFDRAVREFAASIGGALDPG